MKKLSEDQKVILANQALYSVYSSLTMSFIIPFALVLGASNFFVGILNFAQYAAVMLAQLPAERLLERFGRKSVYLTSVPISRLLWIGLVLLPIYFNDSLILMVFFFFMINFFQYIGEPAYVSLVADAVPDRVRGWFFSKKNIVQAFFDTTFFLLAGYYLDLFPKASTLGLQNIILLGIVFGVIAALLIGQLKVPNKDHMHTHKVLDYVRVKGNLRKFIIFMVGFNFAFGLASPFFTVYMIKDLGMNYTWYVWTTILSVVVRVFAMAHFGRICDKYGDRSVAFFCVLGTALVPLSFFFATPTNWWLVIVGQIISGFVWAGVDLTSLNLLLDYTSKNDRTFQTSAYILLTSLPIAISPVIGGWLADNVTIVLSGIPLIFIISGVLRAISSIPILFMPEVRVHKNYSFVTVFAKILAFRPTRDSFRGVQMLASKFHPHAKKFHDDKRHLK